MIDFIQNKSKEIIYECCQKYAAKKKLSTDDVQLILGLNEEGNTYTVCEKYVPKEHYDIKQVLGVKIDFLGYSLLAPPFILKALVRFAQKYGIEVNKVNVMCIPTITYCVKLNKEWVEAIDDEYEKAEKGDRKTKEDIILFLYNGGEYVPTNYTLEIEKNDVVVRTIEKVGIKFEDLFNEEDFEMPV